MSGDVEYSENVDAEQAGEVLMTKSEETNVVDKKSVEIYEKVGGSSELNEEVMQSVEGNDDIEVVKEDNEFVEQSIEVDS